jgi:3-oxoacyl-[acyl-carrier protein] reductase
MLSAPGYTICRDQHVKRNALVRGGADWLDLAATARLAAEDARQSDRSISVATKGSRRLAAERLPAAGVDVILYVAEVTDEQRVREVLREFDQATRPIDVPDTVVGADPIDAVAPELLDLWREVAGVNLTKTCSCAHGAVAHLQRQRYGRWIVTVSSGMISPTPGWLADTASKLGVIGLTRAPPRNSPGVDRRTRMPNP